LLAYPSSKRRTIKKVVDTAVLFLTLCVL